MVASDRRNEDAFLTGVRRFLWTLLIVALILAVWGVLSRVRGRERIGEETARVAVPVVMTVKPGPSPSVEELVLPGNVTAFIEAPIYARTSGYLKNWYTDIGTPVKKGQLLAEIDTPEVDQELRQSKADLATAVANAHLAEITNVRWKGLLANRAVSAQDADNRASNAESSRATVASAAANVRRLEELESFKRVIAPFDGVVTLRGTDIGALINAGQSAGSQLFRVADTSRLRIYVQVPEQFAPRTRPGVQARLRFNEHPGNDYPARVVRTADALDPTLRTLQVELQVDNKMGELLPGAYTEAHFELPGNKFSLRVPATVLMFRAAGLQVAIVGSDSRIKLRDVEEGRDFGTTVEILRGLSVNDAVVVNPPDSITNGTLVRRASPPRQQGTSKQQSGDSGKRQGSRPEK
jgi:RND family efflux transporter MFP subunit